MHDLRYAFRALRRSPGFALVAVLTLALGIGVNTTVYSILHGLLWRPLPVSQPARLAVIYGRPAGGAFADLSYADYRDIRAASGDVFEDVIGYYPVPLSLSDGTGNERAWGELVSGNYFHVLGVSAALGRSLQPTDDRPGAPPAAVLSDAAWRRRFGGDTNAVGRPVRLNGRSFTVVGVAPRGFAGVYFVGFEPELWLPAHAYELVTQAGPGALEQRGGPTFRQMGRLRPGVGTSRAEAAVQTIAARLAADHPETNAGVGAAVLPERQTRPEPEMAGGFGLAASAFLGAVGLVLLVACANVANLLLARAAGRRREIALRLALGASRGRLVRQMLVESAVLAGAGALLGVLLAVWGTDIVGAALRLPTDIPFAFEFGIDAPVLAYAAMTTIVAALAFGLVPALRASEGAIATTLKDGSPGAGAGRGRLRGALVVAQVAVTCVLLVVAGLAGRTFGAVRGVAPGFVTRGGVLASVSPTLERYDRDRGRAFYRDLLARVRAMPGVTSAGLVASMPLEFSSFGSSVHVEGREPRPGGEGAWSAGWSAVSAGYFDAAGTRLLRGRDVGAGDTLGAPLVAVVNRTLAERAWPGADPIGRRLRLDTPDAAAVEVVGVVEDGKYRALTEVPQPYLFLPLDQKYPDGATLVVRTAADDPLTIVPALRGALAELDPEMPLSDVKTMDQLLAGRALLIPRLAAQGAGALSLLTLALAVVGLFGVVSYSVSQRVREIGIRMALGAPRAVVLRLVLGEGLRLTGLGLAVGVPAAAGAALVIRGLLYGVGVADPGIFAGIVVLLVVVTLLATLLPALRAIGVDPSNALRAE